MRVVDSGVVPSDLVVPIVAIRPGRLEMVVSMGGTRASRLTQRRRQIVLERFTCGRPETQIMGTG